MKKLLILCMALVLVLASCGKGGQDTAASAGELKVTVGDVEAEANEALPDENSADLLNPEIIKSAGANSEALAMRKNILESKDEISVSGITYYVSSLKGSDSNDGKTAETPFETLNTAFSVAKEGDAVLLERGSLFRLVNTLTLENGVTYGAYGTGAKPEIWGSIENYADASRWEPYTIRYVWAIDFTGSDVGIIVFNHGELAGNMQYYVRNLKENGDYFFDDTQKVLYVYCDKGNPGSVYDDIEIGSSKTLFRVRNGGRNVTVDNLSFKYTGTFAIHGYCGCKDITITNCVIGWIGGSLFSDKSNRYGNGIEFTSGIQNLTVESCWIYQIYDAGFTFQITNPSGDIKERTYKNITLKNSIIEYCSWAFEWWPSDGGGSVIENIDIQGNIMRFSGYGWAGDTRTPSHIRGPWSEKDCTIKSFLISDNIFDCSNGPVYAWELINDGQFANSLSGNKYYQKMPDTTVKKVFDFDSEQAEDTLYVAVNQQEFNKIVKSVDPKATLIKWLE